MAIMTECVSVWGNTTRLIPCAHPPIWLWVNLQRRGGFLPPVPLDPLALLHVRKILESQAAFGAGFDFLHVVLKMFQAADPAFELDCLAPQYAHATGPRNAPVGHDTAGNKRPFRELENLPHLGVAHDGFFRLGLQQTL